MIRQRALGGANTEAGPGNPAGRALFHRNKAWILLLFAHPVQTRPVSMKPLIRPLGARGVRLFKVYVMKVVLLSTLLLASLSARAELIEAQGSAAILGGDEVYAREQATRDALRQALLASGASVSSIQRLENGSLRSEQI